MPFPIGSAVTWRKEAWQVIGVEDSFCKLLSLDGERLAYVRPDYLEAAP